MHPRTVLLFPAAAVLAALAACSSTRWYENAAPAGAAELRVVSGLDGDTRFVAASRLACRLDPQGRSLGLFSPDADQSAQAGRRGFEHKLGLPGAEGIPRQVYAEYRIEAGKPFFVRADNTSETGDGVVVPPATYVATRRESRAVAGFTPQPGRVYELRYGFARDGAALRLFEVTRAASGAVSKRAVAFDLGERRC